MHENKFTEDDKKKIIHFLNMVAEHAKLTLSTAEIIDYFKLLNHLQNQILPKIEANIFEVIKVTEPEKPKKKEL